MKSTRFKSVIRFLLGQVKVYSFTLPFISALFISPLSGCSLLGFEEEEAISDIQPSRGKSPPRYRTNLSQIRPAEQLTDVELLWEIPKSPVDGYVIDYDYGPKTQRKTIKVRVDELAKFEHKHLGFVYRFILKGVSAHRTTRVILTAFVGDEFSPPSEPIFLEPREAQNTFLRERLLTS